MAEAALRDGSTVEVRPIRPEDKRLLKDGFDRLSAESRFRRFLSPINELDERQLRYLTEVDHHDHEALVAIEPRSGHGVGVGRFVRTDPRTAEVAVTVTDDWQGKGLGTLLLEALAVSARDEGIERFSGLVLETNEDMLDLLRRLGPVTVVDRGEGAVELLADLPPEGAGPHFRELLRLAAREEAAVAGVR